MELKQIEKIKLIIRRDELLWALAESWIYKSTKDKEVKI